MRNQSSHAKKREVKSTKDQDTFHQNWHHPLTKKIFDFCQFFMNKNSTVPCLLMVTYTYQAPQKNKMSKHTVLFCFFFEKAGLSFLQKQHQYDINFPTIISCFVSRNFTEFNASEPFEYPDICFFSSKQKDGCFHIKVNPWCAHEYWKMTLKKKVKEQIQNKTQKNPNSKS